jgi:hypothetical protein
MDHLLNTFLATSGSPLDQNTLQWKLLTNIVIKFHRSSEVKRDKTESLMEELPTFGEL